MRKSPGIFGSLFLLFAVILVLTSCRKEEIVIVYSKINTVSTSNTTYSSTSVDGNIVELTEATHSEFGVAWDTIVNPTVYKNKVLASGTAKVGSFTVTLTGLKPSKTYHVRAFVIDNKKYIYGSDVSFTTSAAALPVVTTTTVTGITSKYAYSGGNVTSAGDGSVIAKGICFDTIAAPTIKKNKTMDGWGTGSFTSSLTNLKPSKKYYVKAYAVSEFGISYGSEVTFTTNDRVFSFHEDFDNNSNDWYTGTFDYGSAEITESKYVMAYQQEGYLWRTWIYVTDISSVANDNDFELNVSLDVNVYPLAYAGASGTAGILWDCGNSSFKYVGIKKEWVSNPAHSSPYYYYTAGSYNGSYTVWKDFTSFTGSDINKISIKKGNGYYYIFINDVQVHKQSYSSLSSDGIGFFAEDAKLKADSLYFDQMGDKKSKNIDMIQLTPGATGKYDVVRSVKNK
jgi:hypothetical protein